MPNIVLIDPDGQKYNLKVENGSSVMENAIKHNIPGIDADCGGACACATCHVYVDNKFLDLVGKPSEMEQDMLDFATDVEKNSRLSCQLEINDNYEGAVFTIADQQ